MQGTIVEVRVFNRHGVDKDERALAIEREEIERLAKDRDDEQAIHDRNVYGRLSELLEGRQGIAGPKGFKKDSKITRAVLDEYPRSQWWQFASPNDQLMSEIEAIRKQYDESKKRLEQRFLDKVEKLQRGDELPPGVQGTIVEVRVFNRHGVDKDERAQAIEREEIERLAKDRDDEQAILDRNTFARLAEILRCLVGSEMCIRDRSPRARSPGRARPCRRHGG